MGAPGHLMAFDMPASLQCRKTASRFFIEPVADTSHAGDGQLRLLSHFAALFCAAAPREGCDGGPGVRALGGRFSGGFQKEGLCLAKNGDCAGEPVCARGGKLLGGEVECGCAMNSSCPCIPFFQSNAATNRKRTRSAWRIISRNRHHRCGRQVLLRGNIGARGKAGQAKRAQHEQGLFGAAVRGKRQTWHTLCLRALHLVV